MTPDRPSVFLVTLAAVEDVGSAALTVLAFARADSEETAKAVAVEDLEGLGWTEIQVVRTGELVDFAALPEDFRGAVDTAVRFGCGLIIYDQP
jgi:hypothetical protein